MFIVNGVSGALLHCINFRVATDPACGSGNFLTETYLSLRRLENEVLRSLYNIGDSQMMIEAYGDDYLNIKVSIDHFHGIEINDFAVSVAKTALWIAEAQMLSETLRSTNIGDDFLPLETSAHIVEGNALRLDWETVVPKGELDYIMGNPPFVGFTFMTIKQKEDMQHIFPGIKNLDFVSAWYKLASDFIQNTKIECGFVSTNSITQGETVARLWPLLQVKINFAHRTFIWNSEANDKAQVHCVIIGFATFDRKKKILFEGLQLNTVQNINPYLVDGPNIIVTSRNKPLCNVTKMVYGNKPADGGNLIIEANDYEEFIQKDPNAKKFIRPLLGAAEYLHNKKRWCIWLEGVSPAEIKKCPLIMQRITKCKESRENSKAAGIRKFAATPTLFAQRTQPMGVDYILIPRVSSERRRYIPMGFLNSNVIVTDAVQIVPNATIYEFGVLTSTIHMNWMRAVAGRLKSDYRYSKDIVYNNFPWPKPTDEQRAKIEETAQGILDARALYPDASLADLYDEVTMPPELRIAHVRNDQAVAVAYGLNKNSPEFKSESACVAMLMKMYQNLTEKS